MGQCSDMFVGFGPLTLNRVFDQLLCLCFYPITFFKHHICAYVGTKYSMFLYSAVGQSFNVLGRLSQDYLPKYTT